jgi:hypothetical protein
MINKKIKGIVFTLSIFLLIYYPPIVSFNTLHIVAAVSYLFLLTHRTAFRELLKVVFKLKGIYFIFLYLFIICLVNGSISSIASMIALTLEVIPTAFVIAFYLKKTNDKGRFLDFLIIAATIQAFISLIAFMIPPLQTAIVEKFISYGMNEEILYMTGWRMYGFSYNLTYAYPIVQSIIASICLYLALNYKTKYFIPIPFMAFSTLINARVGIVILIIGFCSVVFVSFRAKWVNMKGLFLGIFAVLLVLPVMTMIFSNTTTINWVKSGIEEIIDFLSGNTMGEYSYFRYMTDKSKYQLPDSPMTILFGCGKITKGTSAVTDIGFINDIWLGGLIYCISISLFFVRAVIKIIYFYIKSKTTAFILAFSAIVALVLCDIKGQCFSWNEVSVFILMLYVYSIYDKKLTKMTIR